MSTSIFDRDLMQAIKQRQVHPKRRLTLEKRCREGKPWLSANQPSCRRCNLGHIDFVSLNAGPGSQCKQCEQWNIQDVLPFANLMPNGLKVEFIGSDKSVCNLKKNSIQQTSIRNNLKETIQGLFGQGSFSSNYMVSDRIPLSMLTDIPPAHEQTQRQILKNRKNQQFLPLRIGLSSITGAGNGLFATQKLDPHKIVVSYIGQIILTGQFWPPSDSLYGIGWFHAQNKPQFLVIQPVRKLNSGRFMNSVSKDKCNCKIQKCLVNGQVALYIYTIRQIKAGQQLFYHYGDDYTTGKKFDPSTNTQSSKIKPGEASRVLCIEVNQKQHVIPEKAQITPGNDIQIQQCNVNVQLSNEQNQSFALEKPLIKKPFHLEYYELQRKREEEQKLDKLRDLQIQALMKEMTEQKRQAKDQFTLKTKGKGMSQRRIIVDELIQTTFKEIVSAYNLRISKLPTFIYELLKLKTNEIWNPAFISTIIRQPMRLVYNIDGSSVNDQTLVLDSKDKQQLQYTMFQYMRQSNKLFEGQFWKGFTLSPQGMLDGNREVLQRQIFVRKFIFFTYNERSLMQKLHNIKVNQAQQTVIRHLIQASDEILRGFRKQHTWVSTWLGKVPHIRHGKQFVINQYFDANYPLCVLLSRLALYQPVRAASKLILQATQCNERYIEKMQYIFDRISSAKAKAIDDQAKQKEQLSPFKELTNTKLAKLYRQFSRQKYNKYRHQFPRMRQSELVSKIIKQWEGLSPRERSLLYTEYENNNHFTNRQKQQKSPRKSPGSSDIDQPDESKNLKENRSKSESNEKIQRQRSRQKANTRLRQKSPPKTSGVRMYIQQQQKSNGSDFARDQARQFQAQSSHYMDVKINTRGKPEFDFGKPVKRQTRQKKDKVFLKQLEDVENHLQVIQFYYRVLTLVEKATKRQQKTQTEKNSSYIAANKTKDYHSIMQLYHEKQMEKSHNRNQFIEKVKCRLCGLSVACSGKKHITHISNFHTQVYWWQWLLNNFSSPTLFIFTQQESSTVDPIEGNVLCMYKDAPAARKMIKQKKDNPVKGITTECWKITNNKLTKLHSWGKQQVYKQSHLQPINSTAQSSKQITTDEFSIDDVASDLIDNYQNKQELDFEVLKCKLDMTAPLQITFTDSLEQLLPTITQLKCVICYRIQQPLHYGLCFKNNQQIISLDGKQQCWPIPMIKSYIWQKQQDDFSSSYRIIFWVKKIWKQGLGNWLHDQDWSIQYDKKNDEGIINEIQQGVQLKHNVTQLKTNNSNSRKVIFTKSRVRREKWLLNNLGLKKKAARILRFKLSKKIFKIK